MERERGGVLKGLGGGGSGKEPSIWCVVNCPGTSCNEVSQALLDEGGTLVTDSNPGQTGTTVEGRSQGSGTRGPGFKAENAPRDIFANIFLQKLAPRVGRPVVH